MHYIKELYKFMPERPEFLQNKFLRLTPRSEFNDPYDTFPFLDKESQKWKKITQKELNDLESNHLVGMGIISLTESIDNMLMWSHYADSHKGIAIGINPAHPKIKNIKRVRYTRARNRLAKDFPDRGSELFFKSDDWMYEKEWRLIVSFSDADCIINMDNKETLNPKIIQEKLPLLAPVYAFLSLPDEAITSITFGCRVSDDKIQEYKNNLPDELKKITLRQASLAPKRYELKIKRI